MQANEHEAAWEHFPKITPTLTDSGITLRGYRRTDAAMISEASRDDTIPHIPREVRDGEHAVMKYIADNAMRPSRRHGYAFIIEDAETLEPVGHIGAWFGNVVHGRIISGYWVVDRHRGKGYAPRALELLTRWLGTLNAITRIELHIEPWNAASIRTAESAGYTREALMRRWQIVDGYPRDMYMYAYLPEIPEHMIDTRETIRQEPEARNE